MSRNDSAQTRTKAHQTSPTRTPLTFSASWTLRPPQVLNLGFRPWRPAEPPALLLVTRGPNAGSQFMLNQPVTSAGRHPDSDILLDDSTVSRHHVEFRLEDGQFLLVDLDSLNNTYVNHEPVYSAMLVNGDEIQIGKFRLVFLTRPTTGEQAETTIFRPPLVVRGTPPMAAVDEPSAVSRCREREEPRSIASSAIDMRAVLDTADVEHAVILDRAERDAVIAAARHTPAFEPQWLR